MSRIIGIDLGTTNSVVAVVDDNGRPYVVPNRWFGRLTPSVVAFRPDGSCVAGQSALNQRATNPTGTILHAKRLMGRQFTDLKPEDLAVPYQIVKGREGLAAIMVRDEVLLPAQVIAELLAELKRYAEENLGEEVGEAKITVPAYFNLQQRQATMDAARLAGLVCKEVLNEPVAAAIAYGVERGIANGLVAVVDLGGGTLDFTILKIEDRAYRVHAGGGDTQLGGSDWTTRLAKYLADEFAKTHEGVDISGPEPQQRIWDAAEQAKIVLSSADKANVNLPFLAQGPDGPVHMDITVSRTKLEEITADLLDRINGPLKQVLADAKVTANELDEVVLVGGTTRMPSVVGRIRELLDREPRPTVNPDEAIALGAALECARGGGAVTLLDITPLTLGVELTNGTVDVVVPRNTPVPFEVTRTYTPEAGRNTATVRVVQGEQPLARDNIVVGAVRLNHTTIDPRAGKVPIDVRFTLDRNGILSVSATDRGTGNRAEAVMTGVGALSSAEIERLSRKVAAAPTAPPEPASVPA